jgi:hypothetical protein
MLFLLVEPVPISIRLENLTAHFQCLEVSSSLPSLEEAQRAGVERFELADRFNRYTVELLPYSVKKRLSFTVTCSKPRMVPSPSDLNPIKRCTNATFCDSS